MKCDKCGTDNKENNTFCINCGNKLKEETTNDTQNTEITEKTTKEKILKK